MAATGAARDIVPGRLPDGTRLVHVGPPKTGTTSLQGALHAAAPELLAQGVRVAGPPPQPRSAVAALIGRPAYRHEEAPPPIDEWLALAREIRDATEPLVVLSSEILTDGGPASRDRLLRDLDRERVHVVLTLRPLTRILASQWQQEVRGTQRLSYGRWLRSVLAGSGATASYFWRRHRHDRLVADWVAAVGPERVTVVVVDDRDHGRILRAFEGLLGLREGTLVEVGDGANRSMTLPEVEALRAWNVLGAALRLPPPLHHRIGRLVRRIVVLGERDPGEPRVTTPAWALEQAAVIERELVDAVGASGARAVGDLERLATAEPVGPEGPETPAISLHDSVSAAARQLAGMLARRSGRRAVRRLRRRLGPESRA